MAASIRFISAGAGSGKTYTLTGILHTELSEGRVQPGGVLATTFTTKAATELRERVRSHLIRQNAYALANAMGQARIGTVNSVCGGLLQRFAFEAGLPTEQRVLDEERATQLLREAIDVVMEGQALADFLKVARRLCLDEAGHGGGEVPWRKALRTLVDQARANGIDAETLRVFGETNAAQLLAYFPRATADDLDRRLRDAIESVLPTVRTAVERKGQKNTTTYLHRLEACLRDLNHDSMSWAQWVSLSQDEKGPEAGLKPAVQPVVDAAARYAQHPRLHADLRDYLHRMFGLAADALQVYDDL
ncbi:UvrD-helicase domain-containing protein [Cupriavidus plantarum]|uniref:DNA 3'-5' helicase II n=1 Tax=Cupriavidus plantarum TaxID=942865 RepID=A0A316FJ75_9BURK|nr:UvrD-helicase domain-containing protein [Cupriavidus plantarum]PWK37660.1 UvrD/REP helicase N-terminal domain-containing protein [Cupriavidus plantarum]